eukprot:8850401-Pyramimonas_sp.AAC.1
MESKRQNPARRWIWAPLSQEETRNVPSFLRTWHEHINATKHAQQEEKVPKQECKRILYMRNGKHLDDGGAVGNCRLTREMKLRLRRWCEGVECGGLSASEEDGSVAPA